MTAFNQACGSTHSVDYDDIIKTVLDEIIKAQQELQARRTLNTILRSEVRKECSVSVGDSVQIYRIFGKEQRGK